MIVLSLCRGYWCCILTFDKVVNQRSLGTECTRVNRLKQLTLVDNQKTHKRCEIIYVGTHSDTAFHSRNQERTVKRSVEHQEVASGNPEESAVHRQFSVEQLSSTKA